MSKYRNKYRVESARLKGWDYSTPGAYFVTIVTYNRQNLFGEIKRGRMILNDDGKNVYQCWLDIPKHFPHVELDEFIVMPNHVHGIIVIKYQYLNNSVETQNSVVETQNFASLRNIYISGNQFGPQSKNLGSIIRGFKIGVTKWYRNLGIDKNIWQPRFHDHIIRNEKELHNIRQYIKNNPLNWDNDDHNL
ncbi:MAG: transposase [Ignavibacterium sp.]